jgi:hypothetical protein
MAFAEHHARVREARELLDSMMKKGWSALMLPLS